MARTSQQPVRPDTAKRIEIAPICQLPYQRSFAGLEKPKDHGGKERKVDRFKPPEGRDADTRWTDGCESFYIQEQELKN